MAKQKRQQPSPEQRGGKIKVRIIDEVNGLQYLDNVRAVRLTSKGYTLLILEDFTATLGQIEGNVTFLCKDREVMLDNILGYYKHQHNEFTLLIHEDTDGWYKKV